MSVHVRFSNLIEAFLHQVRAQPDRVALLFETPDRRVHLCTWRKLSAAVAACAAQIRGQFDADPALPRRIGHASDNSFADIVIALASMSLGAIEVPIDHRLGADEIARRWRRVGGLWVDDDWRRRLDMGGVFAHQTVRAENVDVDAASLILWTSGTTGTPQGVTLSQRNLAGNAAAKLAAVPQRVDDVRLCVLPLSHAYARTCDFGTWLLSGCTLAVTLGIDGLYRMAPLVRPTLINSVPLIANRMLEETPSGLDRLRLLGCGGAAIAESAFRQWKSRGVTVIQGYGMTETAPVICSATPENALPGLVGRPVDGWECEIRDGQLYVRGPHTMLGYWNDPCATRGKIDRDGWLATGDMVERDERQGQFRILDRVDDVIVLDSGNKIFTSAIQREVEQIAGVDHAILVFRDDLQLWFDADDDSEHDVIASQIRQLLAKHPVCRGCGVHRFAPQLDQAAGELTTKGTVRRSRILQTRFADQLGS